MTKVEELRGKIVDMAQGVSFAEIANFIGLLDAYAAAAREEGAERGRMKILSEATFLPRNYDARETEYFYGEREGNGDVEVLAREGCYLLRESSLAPKGANSEHT